MVPLVPWEWERCHQERSGAVGNDAAGTGMAMAPTVIGERAVGDALLPARNVQWCRGNGNGAARNRSSAVGNDTAGTGMATAPLEQERQRRRR
jgi:hypothetical protein